MHSVWSWTWQGIFGNALYAVLYMGAATMLTWIKRKWPTHGNTVRDWMVFFTALILIVYAVTGFVPFINRPIEIEENNVESFIKQWSEQGGYSVAKVDLPDTYFAYTITTPNGNAIQVLRSTKSKTSNIQFISTITAPFQVQNLLGSLSADQVATLSDELSSELDKQKIGFNMGIGQQQQTPTKNVGALAVILIKGIPIKEITNANFWQSVDDMNFAAQFVIADSDLIIRKLTANTLVTSSTKTTATP